MVLVTIKHVPEQCRMSLAWGIGSTLFSSTSAFLQQFYTFEVSAQRGKMSCLRPSMPPGSGFRLRSLAPSTALRPPHRLFQKIPGGLSGDGLELITLQNHTLPLNSPMICQWDERQKLKMIAACGYVTFLLKGRRGQSGNRSWASVVLSLGTPSSAQGHSGG